MINSCKVISVHQNDIQTFLAIKKNQFVTFIGLQVTLHLYLHLVVKDLRGPHLHPHLRFSPAALTLLFNHTDFISSSAIWQTAWLTFAVTAPSHIKCPVSIWHESSCNLAGKLLYHAANSFGSYLLCPHDWWMKQRQVSILARKVPTSSYTWLLLWHHSFHHGSTAHVDGIGSWDILHETLTVWICVYETVLVTLQLQNGIDLQYSYRISKYTVTMTLKTVLKNSIWKPESGVTDAILTLSSTYLSFLWSWLFAACPFCRRLVRKKAEQESVHLHAWLSWVMVTAISFDYCPYPSMWELWENRFIDGSTSDSPVVGDDMPPFSWLPLVLLLVDLLCHIPKKQQTS